MISRITTQAGFARFRGVRPLRHGSLTLRAVPDAAVNTVHLALATPKRSGTAVARNRVRRQVRAAMRERAHRLPNGWYLVTVVGAAVDTNWGRLGISLDTLVEEVRSRQGNTLETASPHTLRTSR